MVIFGFGGYAAKTKYNQLNCFADGDMINRLLLFTVIERKKQ